MSEANDKVIRYYGSFDEWGRLDREPVEYLVNAHHIKENLSGSRRVLDIGGGPGKYAIALAREGYEVTLADLSPRLVEQARIKAREFGVESRMGGFHVADARDLSLFEDERFDASLMLGPMYHLQSSEDRLSAVTELNRVTKRGGIVFVAFMSRLRHLATSLLDPVGWRPNDNARSITEFMDTGMFDHSDEGRFTGAYFSDIDWIEGYMEENGFESVKLIASSSVAGAMKPEQWAYWRDRGEEETILRMVFEASESPYLLGSSSHLLYIGRKK
ncbi:class I SAM-dependent methyltransferase [Cohnella endophytica]|uniref:Class I SAM-dependent methyltransferase n=1 Tax=Cohnella endophytica TaxID=2419778 RepID=A0A494XW70_9BACL|nr:class I SAM-dependent methyltransferase [Cohnella endophytica]RKP53216.1 class I SAM-dependent methyltransferase [Cohnella endophytica]